MKTALITTTINVPTVLALYRQHGSDIAFFVAGDQKTPHEDVRKFIADKCATGFESQKQAVGAHYFDVEQQKALGYKCSELIGWNSIQRRNIALLEAVKWGADIIVSVDDDNIPLDQEPIEHVLSYFKSFERTLTSTHSGIKVSGINGWFDVGRLLDPAASHRGFPIAHRNDLWRADPVTDAKVGVAAGICLGDPDISATTRIERYPEVHRVSELLQSGIVVDPQTWTVWNSQNTAIIRELAPAWGMVPFVQRYDDILASLVCGRVMRERGLHAHLGKPFVWQQRNQHDLMKDLRGELLGMEIIERFAFVLDETKLAGKSVVDDCRVIWKAVDQAVLLPEKSIKAMLAYTDDCEELGL